MSLYPSLEDMQVDLMVKAQINHMMAAPQQNFSAPALENTASYGDIQVLYPSLNDFMGLELSEDVIARNMPEYMQVAMPSSNSTSAMIAPLSSQSLGLQRAQVTHGIRQLILCKGADGKVGVRVKAINKGIFACLVSANSPAALAGLRFGDQILQINNIPVAGYTMDQVHDMFRKSPINGISVVVRDRPFERTITLHKDSTRHIGFQFKNGKIVGLIKDSSAAKNGVLTDHNLLEINGQNVAGLKDKEITKIINAGGQIITITVIPTFIYDHMIKSMATSLLKGSMDHSIPNV